MTTTVTDNTADARFEIEVDGVRAGLADYRIVGSTIHFTHTETDRAFAGQGLARRLVETALTSAREAGLSVEPHCPFVRKVIADAPEAWLDLVRPDRRPEFDLPLE